MQLRKESKSGVIGFKRDEFNVLLQHIKDYLCNNGDNKLTTSESEHAFANRLADMLAIKVALTFDVVFITVVLVLRGISKISLSVWCKT